MLSDSAINGPAAPSFHNAHESKTREQDNKTDKQPGNQLIQPITAAPWHLIHPPLPCSPVVGLNFRLGALTQ